MKRMWTENQSDAINVRGGSVIVSAAAGSGKTAVLVERVVRLVTDENGVDADRLLVVTYTRAAAAEIKERIAAALQKRIRENPSDKRLIRQQSLMSKAHISTVDAFCASLVRENFYILDIDRNFRVGDEGELSLIKADAMRLTLDSLYAEGSRKFYALVEAFASAKDDLRLENNILKLYDFVRSHPFPKRWMKEKLGYYTDFRDASSSVWGTIIGDYTVDALSYMENLYDSGYEAMSGDEKIHDAMATLFESYGTFLSRLKSAVEEKSWDKIREALSSYEFGKFTCPRGYKDHPLKLSAAASRQAIKKVVEELRKLYAQDEAMCLYDIEIVKDYAQEIFRAVEMFSENYAMLKKERGIADYGDLEHWTLELLIDQETMRRTKLAEEIAARFDEIMVDEFQDANETQDTMFRALSHDEENLFVVGDVKQSIYGFRQAMPELFLKRKNNATLYNREKAGFPAKIILEKNFRSESGVLAAVNYFFEKLMSPSVGDISYNEEERLYVGAQYEPATSPAIELDVIDKNGVGEEIAAVAEARFIAEKILGMVSDGYPVKDGDSYRPAEYGDFAVLMRSVSKYAPLYIEIFEKYGIVAHSERGEGFLGAREIMVMTNLLRIINNPALDIEMLSAVMSPLFAFDEDDMARIRSSKKTGSLYSAIITDAHNGSRKSKSFLDELGYYRSISVTVPLSKLINIIYERTSLLSLMSAADSSSNARNNLRMLLDYARSFEQNTHKGLSAFIGYLDRLIENHSDLAAAGKEKQAAYKGVEVMSVHASKGLEFPVCFIANTATRFVFDAVQPVLLHPEYGYAQKRYDPALSANYDTLPRTALSLELERSEKSEEMRILYVALTRAKQKLILLSTPRYGVESYLKGISEKLSGERALSPFVVRAATSLSDWIVMCAMLHPDGGELREYASIEVDHEHNASFTFECHVIRKPFGVSAQDQQQDEENDSLNPVLREELRKHVGFEYPYQGLRGLPVKVAASELAHQNAVNADERYLSRPAFLSNEELNSAEKGTALHAFMQYADFAAARADITAELDRLIEGGYLTQAQADSIDIERAQRFIGSSLVDRCLDSDQVYKEYQFNIKIPASTVNPDIEEQFRDEPVILQGAVDLAFVEDNELVIVDYKTDRVKHAEALRELYSTQLMLYKNALEQCLEREVKECIIYSVRHGEEVKVY